MKYKIISVQSAVSYLQSQTHVEDFVLGKISNEDFKTKTRIAVHRYLTNKAKQITNFQTHNYKLRRIYYGINEAD